MLSYPKAGYPIATLPNSDRDGTVAVTAPLTGEATGIATSAASAIAAP